MNEKSTVKGYVLKRTRNNQDLGKVYVFDFIIMYICHLTADSESLTFWGPVQK